MHNARRALRKLFAPVTIMLIPHCSRKPLGFRIPYIVIFSFLVFSLWSGVGMYHMYQNAALYAPTKAELDLIQSNFQGLRATMSSLQMADMEFKRLFSMDSKEEVLDNLDTSDMGALDMDVLKRQIEKTIQNVGEIRDYLSLQRDLYRATPMGWPVNGWVSSGYGFRIHPIKRTRDFHSGMDISTRPSTSIRSTADGIVSFAGRSGANGNLVAIEHGFGYSTYYAHNKKIMVKVGQIVKRGDIIALVGSTGSSTGPHLHYEVWKDGKTMNPRKYLKGGSW